MGSKDRPTRIFRGIVDAIELRTGARIDDVASIDDVAEAIASEIERSENIVWIGHARYVRTGLRGVPRSFMDVCITTHKPAYPAVLVVDVTAKPGKYDGAVRPRVVLRWIGAVHEGKVGGPLDGIEHVVVTFDDKDDGDGKTLGVVHAFPVDRPDASPYVLGSGKRLETEVTDPTTLQRMLVDHWRDYFKHLRYEDDDIALVADGWAATCDYAGRTRNDLFREAGRVLYAHAVALGWKKMTVRDRERWGLTDHGAWIRVEELDRLRGFPASGTGEATRFAASGAINYSHGYGER